MSMSHRVAQGTTPEESPGYQKGMLELKLPTLTTCKLYDRTVIKIYSHGTSKYHH